MKVWVAGTLLSDGGNDWSLIGVFSDEGLAVGSCQDGNDFVAPVQLNAIAPRENTPWPDIYRPLFEGPS